MSISYKDLEKISAYIDGGLSDTERAYIEERIATSKEYKKIYDEYVALKQSVSSLPSLPEDLYFETRLMQRISEEKSSFLKIILTKKPVLVFSLLTIFLMLLLREYPDFLNDSINEGQKNLAAFYSQNLKPLVFAADLNKEAIFDFAFNQTIPINESTGQVLALGRDKDGKEFLEMKFSENNPSDFKLDHFISSLNLTPEQEKEVDSILLSYSDDIATNILVNENNALAVSKNIWSYQNAIRTDLLQYAAKISKDVSKFLHKDIISLSNDDKKFISMTDKENNNFIFITPDTFFTKQIDVDKKLLEQDLFAAKKLDKSNRTVLNIVPNININVKKRTVEANADNDIKVFVGGNNIKIELRKIEIPPIPNVPNISSNETQAVVVSIDSLDEMIEDAVNKFKAFSFSWTEKENKKGKKKNHFFMDSLKIGENIPKEFQFEFKKLDSLQHYLNRFFSDSLTNYNWKEWNENMQQFQKEMEKFREEMNLWRKESEKQKQQNKKTEIKFNLEI